MIILLKDAILIAVAVLTAVLAGLGVAPSEATAPDLPPPGKITVQVEENQPVATTTPETSPQQEEATSTPKEAPETATTPPEIDPFKDLAESFAKLAEEQKNEPTPIETILDVNQQVRKALVNIICTTEVAGPLNSISASGVIIDPRGIIVTNSHVAQYFLLKNYPIPNFVSCIIRGESPAVPLYTAELLFLPPSWIAKNAQKIDDESPTGNGEHDWAFLHITGVINPNNVLPTEFPYLALSAASPTEGSTVLLGGYPAGFLGGITVAKELYAASAETKVGQLYTYSGNTVDLFSIGGTIVAQQGSSGGAVATKSGVLSGVIVTSSEAENTAARDLRALSTEYIMRDFQKERGIDFATFLTLNPSEQARIFNITIAPTLTKALIEILNN